MRKVDIFCDGCRKHLEMRTARLPRRRPTVREKQTWLIANVLGLRRDYFDLCPSCLSRLNKILQGSKAELRKALAK
jgi:Zn finger protein HypA/HybF involved in hydrogenase expression